MNQEIERDLETKRGNTETIQDAERVRCEDKYRHPPYSLILRRGQYLGTKIGDIDIEYNAGSDQFCQSDLLKCEDTFCSL